VLIHILILLPASSSLLNPLASIPVTPIDATRLSAVSNPPPPFTHSPSFAAVEDGKKGSDIKSLSLAASSGNKYLELCEAQVAVLLKEDTLKEGWAFSHEEKDIAVWTKTMEGTICLKAVGVVNASPTDVLAVLADANKRKWYDDTLEHCKLLEDVDEHTQVVYSSFKTQQLCRTAMRDIVAVSYWRRLPNGFGVLVAKSVEHAAAAVKTGYVRADLVHCGWVIKPSLKDPNRSLVTYVIHIDMKGVLPSFAMEVFTRRQPMCVHAIRTLFAHP